ncbi:MAG: alpha-ribazole phosphatase [Bacillota bacterium]
MSKIKELTIIRHGETEWNKAGRYQGQLDVELNQKGREQAEKAASYLSQKEMELFISSDLSRARQTAEIIAAEVRIKAEEILQFSGLRELDFGTWEGQRFEEIKADQPEALSAWIQDPLKNPPPEGEGLLDFQERIQEVFRQILARPEKKIAVVTHGGVVLVYLASVLGLPLANYRRLAVSNTGISQVTYYEDEPVVRLFNSTAHLD